MPRGKKQEIPMCQHKTNVHKVSGAFPPTGRDRRAGTTFALPHQHAIDVPPARHRRDTSSLALCRTSQLNVSLTGTARRAQEKAVYIDILPSPPKRSTCPRRPRSASIM